MSLNLTMKQTMTVTPRMITAMAVLQLGVQELTEYMQTLSNENPFVELAWPERASAGEQFAEKLRWLRQNDRQNRSYYIGEQERRGGEGGYRSGQTIAEFIKEQLLTVQASPQILRLAAFLADMLDGRGFLRDTPAQLAALAGVPEPQMEEAIRLLRSLEPTGVGAADAQECLLLQLERMELEDDTAWHIIQSCMKQLAAHQYDRMAELLHVTRESVEAACAVILTLNPNPAAGFAVPEPTVSTPPDVYVERDGDGWAVRPNDEPLPKLHVNGYYLRLLEQTEDPAVKAYLRERLRQMKTAVQNIDNRKSTLIRCAQSMVRWQAAFFDGGQLRPMTLADMAQELDVHESTVSRAVKDKYLQCDRGLLAFQSLFTRNIGGNASLCCDNAKELLKRIVADEDRARPLSDEKIVRRMAAEGAVVSRRTVAKYRSELGIPAAFARKF